MKKSLFLKIQDRQVYSLKTDNERFVAVEDEWFDPIRELSK